MEGTKKLRFQQKAGKIITNVYSELEKLKTLTNSKYYNYSEDEIEAMFTYLTTEMAEIRSLFRKKEPFSFGEEVQL